MLTEAQGVKRIAITEEKGKLTFINSSDGACYKEAKAFRV